MCMLYQLTFVSQVENETELERPTQSQRLFRFTYSKQQRTLQLQLSQRPNPQPSRLPKSGEEEVRAVIELADKQMAIKLSELST